MIFIGIDGGGTTTRLLIQHGDAEPKYFERQISLKVRNGDFAASAEKLREMIAEINEIETILPIGPYAIAIGLSGMSREEDQEGLKSAIFALPELSTSKIHIESDATITLRTVLPEGEEGILLIAGTGSVIFYQPLGQAPRRIGGWGPFLSDDGSGYRIGLRALRRYFWVLDGVYPPDALTERIRAHLTELGMEDTQDRAAITMFAESNMSFVASLAWDTLETASGVGEIAQNIKQMIIEELIEIIAQLFPMFLKGLMSGQTPYKLYLAGSIAKHPIMLETLGKTFETTDLTLVLVDDSAPAMKALEIAKWMS